jgi:hypothetical protein
VDHAGSADGGEASLGITAVSVEVFLHQGFEQGKAAGRQRLLLA